MTTEITDLFVDLVLQTNPELDARLEYQAEALRETKCIQPLVGQYIDAHHVEYLLSALALGEKDFAESFPAMSRIAGPDRRQVAATIESHIERCSHCSLKRAYDLELDARIEQAFKLSNDLLPQLSEQEEQALAEDAVMRT